jgi:hypothetical protein
MSASDRNSRTGYYVLNAVRRLDMILSTPTRARTQTGFVITAAQVTLALVSLAVSATAFSLGSAAQDEMDHQLAGVHAAHLQKVGGVLQGALRRAVDDNGLSHDRPGEFVSFEDGRSEPGRIRLFDEELGYGRLPAWPTGLLIEDPSVEGQPRWSEESAGVVEVKGVDLAVCRRFNQATQGEDAKAEPPADLKTAVHTRRWKQGCVAEPGASHGTWFMQTFAV